MRYIRINENGKIICIREAVGIVEGEIPSEIGELGQVLHEGQFIDDMQDIVLSKQDKISLLSKECEARIINGIDFTWEGETHRYSLDITDQMEISTLRLNLLNGTANQTTWHYNGGECTPWEKSKFLAFAEQALTFATYTKIRFNSGIRPLVQSMEDLVEINAVTLDTELSPEVEAKIMELVSITLTGQ